MTFEPAFTAGGDSPNSIRPFKPWTFDMPNLKKISPPTLDEGRTVTHVVLPASATHLHERHAPYAALLAELWGVPLHLMHVSDSVIGSDPQLDAVVENLRHSRPGLEIFGQNVYGDDVAKALAEAIGPHALVIMGSDHADPWKIKGSVAGAVAAHVGAPLLLLGPQVRESTISGEIVVAMDGSFASEEALRRAAALSVAFGGHPRVWIVRVVPVPVGEAIGTHRNIALALQAQAEAYPEVDVRWEVIQSNDPIDAIAQFASRRRASFIVTGMKSRNDRRRRTMGSVTMGLVQRARQPVMPVPGARLHEKGGPLVALGKLEGSEVAT